MPQLMKGHTFSSRKHKMTYPAIAEIKYDEVRTHVIVCPQTGTVQYLSYAGKPLNNLEEYSKYWVELAKDTGYYEFDTGYIHGESFDDTFRWVRSNTPPADLFPKHGFFVLFDLPELASRSYAVRRSETLKVVHTNAYAEALDIQVPQCREVLCEADVMPLYSEWRAQGFEGMMLKSYSHLYEPGKRSNGWLKVKPSEDADGVLEAVIEAVDESGVPLRRAGSLVLRMSDGSVARPHGIPHALATEIWNDAEKFIGQCVEFKYMERDRAGGYRHPTFNRFREATE